MKTAPGSTGGRGADRFFGPFERLIDPFRPMPDADMPSSLGAFILHFLRQARWPFVAFLVLSGLVSLTETSLFWLVGVVIDALAEGDPADIWRDHAWLIAGMVVLLVVVRPLVWAGSALVNEQALVPGFFQLVRWQTHRRVLRQSYSYFQDDFAGRVATKVMQSGQSLGDLAINSINSVWVFVVFAVTMIGLFASLHWQLAAVMIVWFAIYLTVVLRMTPHVRERSRQMSNQRAAVNGRIVDSYTNIQSVKLFAGTAREDTFAREALATHQATLARFTRLITTLRMFQVTLNGVMLVVLGWMCIAFWQAAALTLGEVAAVLALALRLNNMSGWMMMQINGVFRDLGTIQDTMDTVAKPIHVVDGPEAQPLVVRDGAVAFQGVTFHYGQASGALDKLSFDIAGGEKVGIVGPSGAGKTTLMNVLLRLYDLEGGRILVDGQDVAHVTQDSLRDQMGVVTQDTSLLHRSVADNIAYGRPDASADEIERAARRARAHDFILGLRDVKGRTGYDAHVGERGVKLSGGQRQRIAIARTFLKDAPILMLDEATSALDSQVESAIQESLLDLMAGKTVVAIAHRLSTIAHLDRLIVMAAGRIVEEGTHASLIARSGLYADLWARQSGGFLTEMPAAAE